MASRSWRAFAWSACDEYKRSHAFHQGGGLERVECICDRNWATDLAHELGHRAGSLACQQQIEDSPRGFRHLDHPPDELDVADGGAAGEDVAL
jgi:hypothetical protein